MADLNRQLRLQPLPEGFTETRDALRRLAVYVLSPARKAVEGRIGLRSTAGGFGTPFFGAGEQLRVEGTSLVRQRGQAAESAGITSLAAAAACTGIIRAEEPGGASCLPELGKPS